MSSRGRSRRGAANTGVLPQTGFAFLIRLIGAGLSLALTVAITRSLGSSGSGTYYLAFTVVFAAATIARFGLDKVILRDASSAIELGELHMVRASWDAALAATLGLGILTTAILWMVAPLAASVFDDTGLVTALRAMSFAVVPMNVLLVASETIRAKGRVAAAVAAQVALVPALTIPLVAAIALRQQDTPTTLSVAYAVGVCVAALGSTLALRPDRLGPRAQSETRKRFGPMLRTGRPLVLASALGLVTAWTDTIMLGLWTDTADVGVYSAVIRVALVVGFATYAVNSVVAPRFAAIKASGGTDRLAALSGAANALALVVAAPIALVLIAGAEQILGIFGVGFADGRTALMVLASSHLLAAVFASCGFLLMMTGSEKLFRNSVLVGAILNVAMNALLIPQFAVVGAAAATGLTVIAVGFASFVQVRHAYGFWALPRFRGAAALLRSGKTD